MSFSVHVLGDAVIDWLMAEHQSASTRADSEVMGPERIAAVPVLGGAWFVAHFVEAALAADRRLKPDADDHVATYRPDWADYHVATYQPDWSVIGAIGSRVPQAVWDLGLFPRFRDESRDLVYRIKRSRGYDFSEKVPELCFNPNHASTIQDIIIIDDMNLGFRDSQIQVENVRQRLTENQVSLAILLISGKGVPRQGNPRSKLWELLVTEFSERTVVIVSGNALRHIGAKISRRLSWEATTEDYVREIERVTALKGFRHIITRFGITGAIYTRRTNGDSSKHLLAYDPDATDGIFRDRERDGNIVGSNSVFVACMVRALRESAALEPEAVARIALESSLTSCQRLFRSGYGETIEHLRRLAPTYHVDPSNGWGFWVHRSVFDLEQTKDDFGKDYREGGELFTIDLSLTSASPLGDVDTRFQILTDRGSNPEQLFKVAKDIVLFGVDKIVSFRHDDPDLSNWSKEFKAPIARFGDGLIVIDRASIENYRSVTELIRHYVQSGSSRPLSIAVFGPPGAGKSFVTRTLAESVDRSIVFMSCNLSHFRHGSNDLEHEFIKVLDESRSNRLPLMLFDEFDSDGLIYLKSFLEPMEDSRFRYGERELRLGRAIFAFAGGVYGTYDDFVGRTIGQESEEEYVKYKMLKVPDFLSRLSGFLTILGVEREGQDYTFLIRRAILLRSFLEKRGLTGAKKGKARIDETLINAFLGVNRFYHGARSIRAILETCPTPDGIATAAYLQPKGKLAMHVDADEFDRLLLSTESEVINYLTSPVSHPPSSSYHFETDTHNPLPKDLA